MVLKKIGRSWCVVHTKKKGMIGKPIKCFSTKQFGIEGAKTKAKKMHIAITLSQLRAKGRKIPLPKQKRIKKRTKKRRKNG